MKDTLTSYEITRLKNIERNKILLNELGLNSFLDIEKKSFKIKNNINFKKKTKNLLNEKKQKLQRRTSSRLNGKEPIQYDIQNISEIKKDKKKTYINDYKKEEYDESYVKKLGSCKTPWPHVNFVKTYDTIRGTTCHQCRQKTLDKKTKCFKCKAIRGQFCGVCLQNRYGENIDEVFQLDYWECPVCRDICNCSICRKKKGLPPTGIMTYSLEEKGYPSVAHFLILTNLKKKEKKND